MKRILKSFMCLSLVLALSVGTISQAIVIADEKPNEMTREQSNAIQMLNYITVLTQEIDASKNSRVFLEEAYSSLLNNTTPSAVDSRTLSQMDGLLDTMESFRMINVKRERLKYIYDQNQAQAIRSAIPNPMGLLSAVGSFSPTKIAAAVAYMAVDATTSYKAYTTEAEKKYLQDGWALDEEEARFLHESRKGAFSYMVSMVNDYHLPDESTLTPRNVEELVEWKNSDNPVGKIQFLESNEKTYRDYGGYWLILAESYYMNKNYEKCLDAVKKYEGMNIRIFRKDYDFAHILPLAISSAKETYKDINKYAPYAKKHAQMIIDNTDHDDWALRYFAAQTLVDLYSENKDKECLDNAYSYVRDNVNYLRKEQNRQNDTFLKPIIETPIEKDAKKEEKEEIKKYNKMQKESRETEMPPIYEPLLLNCEMLFALADEKKISKSDKDNIDKMLHTNNDNLFLVQSIDDLFWFDKSNKSTPAGSPTMILSKSEIVLPAAYFTKDSIIKVTVKKSDGTVAGEFVDWVLDEVDRKEESNISTFDAHYKSPTFKKFDWEPNMKIQVDIVCLDGLDKKYHFDYKTVGTKNQWYEYGKVWESEVKFEAGK